MYVVLATDDALICVSHSERWTPGDPRSGVANKCHVRARRSSWPKDPQIAPGLPIWGALADKSLLTALYVMDKIQKYPSGGSA